MENLKNAQLSDPSSFLREFRNACASPVMLLRHIAQAMAAEMQAGLDHPGAHRLKMLPTYVECLPSGKETGLFYAVDLGGTNFRVLRVQLAGQEGRIVKQESEEVRIPHEVMTGSSKDLFTFLASTIIQFVSKEADLGFKCLALNEQRDIGFTFSFPVNQTKVNRGEILKWTKGFSINDAVGQDVVEQLQTALEEVGSHHTKVICLVNDTVGTLAQCRYWNEDAMVGVILGTGTNACYVERPDAIPCWNSSPDKDMTVINVEWGNFYLDILPRTFADEGLDKDSLNPGQQEFEKMIGGMYMGEIVRRVLLKMAQDTALFGKKIPERLTQPFALTTPHMSKMHGDDTPDLQIVGSVIEEAIGVTDTTLATRKAVHDVCGIIAERAARLSAAGIVGILKKIGRCGDIMNGCLTTTDSSRPAKKTVVAIDGSLYEKYTKFRVYMEDAMKEMLGEDYADNVTTELSKDGSGVGAALLAAAISTDLGLGNIGVSSP